MSATLKEDLVYIDAAGGARLVSRVSNKQSHTAFILSHPYGPLGGDMNNNVVFKLTSYLSGLGFSTLRFNFRGIRGSTGRASWRGGGEIEDMKAMVHHALNLGPTPPSKIILIGYSYGSVIASAVGGETAEVLAYAAISYPFSVSWALTLFHGGKYLTQAASKTKAKLFIMGDKDNFTSIQAFMDKVRALPSPLEVITIKDADHFFFGTEHVLCRIIRRWLEKVFGSTDLKAIARQSKNQFNLPTSWEDGTQEL